MTMLKILIVIFAVFSLGCSSDEHPSYEIIHNSLKSGGPTINYDPNSSLTNISEIQEYLSEIDELKFTKSLAWYGTESNFGFEKIHNRNAKELVDIVNCLKTNSKNEQEKCFK